MYLVLLLIPIGILALLIPSMVSQGEDLANNAPQYAEDVTDFVNRNETLSNLNQDYDITGKIEEEAAKLPDKIPDAAGTLQDIGVGFVNSVFAALTIFILSIFMVASGRYWIERFLETRHPDQKARMERALDHIGQAVGNYVGGALLQATIAGVTSFILLTILGVPFAAALALVVFFFDLIPLVGATLGGGARRDRDAVRQLPGRADRVGDLLDRLPADRELRDPASDPEAAVSVEPFVVLVAVLFGATLFGIIGALLAIPAAASILDRDSRVDGLRRSSRRAPAPPPELYHLPEAAGRAPVSSSPSRSSRTMRR